MYCRLFRAGEIGKSRSINLWKFTDCSCFVLDPFQLHCTVPSSPVIESITMAPEKHMTLTLTLEVNNDMRHCVTTYIEQFTQNLRSNVASKQPFSCPATGPFRILVAEDSTDDYGTEVCLLSPGFFFNFQCTFCFPQA